MGIVELWLPILAAGLATHLLSTIAWTVMPHHKPEWKPIVLEGDLASSLRLTTPGEQYLLNEPGGDGSEGMDPARCKGMLLLWKHKPSMGKNIGMTLAYFFFCAITIGYLADIAFPAGSETAPLDVFRFAATIALLTHAVGGLPSIIWFRRKFWMDFLDGVAYAAATGAAFALLWPR